MRAFCFGADRPVRSVKMPVIDGQSWIWSSLASTYDCPERPSAQTGTASSFTHTSLSITPRVGGRPGMANV